MITLDALDFLASAAGAGLLARLATDDLAPAHHLRLITALRKTYPPAVAAAALELATLRAAAVGKFGAAAAGLFFTRDALEQASDPLARAYHAACLAVLPGADEAIADVCCGIGADTLALAAAGLSVTGYDRDPLRLRMAALNADALGLTGRVTFTEADVTDDQYRFPGAAFFDPARRDGTGRRLFDVDAYLPPLSTVRGWDSAAVLVKLSPGVEVAQVAAYGGVLEFVSVGGDLKEALLHTAPGTNDLPPGLRMQRLRAVRLTADGPVTWDAAQVDLPPDLHEPGGWLIEPDPALIRAGLVRMAGAAWGAWQMDETIAYLCAEVPPADGWARSWRILDWLPFQLKRLRAALVERGIDQITVKKRGSPITPEALIAGLKLKARPGQAGETEAVVVLTRLRGDPIAILCAPCGT